MMHARNPVRFGLLLDGPLLVAATTSRGVLVDAETMTGQSGPENLGAWWDRTRPRGTVTVALLTAAALTAELELAPDLPGSLARRHLEVQMQAGASGAVAVATRTTAAAGQRCLARVTAVPARLLDGLTPFVRRAVRFTLPAMAYTVGGLHLVVGRSASELCAVRATGADEAALEDSLLLSSGGVDPSADGPTRRFRAEAIAEEVERTIESWRRRGEAVGRDVVTVAGTAVPEEELFDALRLRGYRPERATVTDRIDPVTCRGPAPGPRSGSGETLTPASVVLAAAVSVCEPGPLGFLVAPANGGTSRPPSESGSPSTRPRWRREAACIVTAGALVAGVAWAIPGLLGTRELRAADSRHQSAETVLRADGTQLALYNFDARFGAARHAATGPPWGVVVPAIMHTAPQGISVQTMDLQARASEIAVSLTATAADPTLVPTWLSNLQHHHVEASVAGVTVDPAGAATFTVSFVVPWTFS